MPVMEIETRDSTEAWAVSARAGSAASNLSAHRQTHIKNTRNPKYRHTLVAELDTAKRNLAEVTHLKDVASKNDFFSRFKRKVLSLMGRKSIPAERWDVPIDWWKSAVQLAEGAIVRFDLFDRIDSGVQFSTDDLAFLNDPVRNIHLNYTARGKWMTDTFYRDNPSIPRAFNFFKGTYLFNATEGCEHKMAKNSSGINCANCPGWFCY